MRARLRGRRGRFTAVGLLMVLALAANGRDTGAETMRELAPAGACPGGEAVQESLLCFVNWARRAHGHGPVNVSDVLERAAAHKAAAILRCGGLSHEPCGADATTSVRSAGYVFARWGENLYAGWGGQSTPRAAVRAWLDSPPHRAVLLGAYRDAGAVRLVRRGASASAGMSLWVLELGTPRQDFGA